MSTKIWVQGWGAVPETYALFKPELLQTLPLKISRRLKEIVDSYLSSEGVFTSERGEESSENLLSQGEKAMLHAFNWLLSVAEGENDSM